jgi:hypothetical protein
MDATHFL